MFNHHEEEQDAKLANPRPDPVFNAATELMSQNLRLAMELSEWAGAEEAQRWLDEANKRILSLYRSSIGLPIEPQAPQG